MQICVTRQPVFDASMHVRGYELQYEDTASGPSDRRDLEEALVCFCQGQLLHGKQAFVRLSENLIYSGLPGRLYPDEVVLILPAASADGARMAVRAAALQKAGFTLAAEAECLCNGADLLPHVAVLCLSFDVAAEPSDRAIPSWPDRITGLAERVETQQAFDAARQAGCLLFQGGFCTRPVVFSRLALSSSAATYTRAIQEILRPNADFTAIASIIRADVSLTYRLLQHVNTLQFCPKTPVTSVLPAITRMGVQATFRWLMVVMMQDMTHLSSSELPKLALTRASFCNQICSMLQTPYLHDEAYLVGMFSIVGQGSRSELTAFFQEIFIAPVVLDALLYGENLLAEILSLVLAYESAAWGSVRRFGSHHHLSVQAVIGAYVESVRVADQMY